VTSAESRVNLFTFSLNSTKLCEHEEDSENEKHLIEIYSNGYVKDSGSFNLFDDLANKEFIKKLENKDDSLKVPGLTVRYDIRKHEFPYEELKEYLSGELVFVIEIYPNGCIVNIGEFRKQSEAKNTKFIEEILKKIIPKELTKPDTATVIYPFVYKKDYVPKNSKYTNGFHKRKFFVKPAGNGSSISSNDAIPSEPSDAHVSSHFAKRGVSKLKH
jgi:hypothetical protein